MSSFTCQRASITSRQDLFSFEDLVGLFQHGCLAVGLWAALHYTWLSSASCCLLICRLARTKKRNCFLLVLLVLPGTRFRLFQQLQGERQSYYPSKKSTFIRCLAVHSAHASYALWSDHSVASIFARLFSHASRLASYSLVQVIDQHSQASIVSIFCAFSLENSVCDFNSKTVAYEMKKETGFYEKQACLSGRRLLNFEHDELLFYAFFCRCQAEIFGRRSFPKSNAPGPALMYGDTIWRLVHSPAFLLSSNCQCNPWTGGLLLARFLLPAQQSMALVCLSC